MKSEHKQKSVHQLENEISNIDYTTNRICMRLMTGKKMISHKIEATYLCLLKNNFIFMPLHLIHLASRSFRKLLWYRSHRYCNGFQCSTWVPTHFCMAKPIQTVQNSNYKSDTGRWRKQKVINKQVNKKTLTRMQIWLIGWLKIFFIDILLIIYRDGWKNKQKIMTLLKFKYPFCIQIEMNQKGNSDKPQLNDSLLLTIVAHYWLLTEKKLITSYVER